MIVLQILKDSSLFKDRGNDHGWAKDSANAGVSGGVILAKDSFRPVRIAKPKQTVSVYKDKLTPRPIFPALLAPLFLAGLMSQHLT